MASQPSNSPPDGAAITPPDQLIVNLQVVSPSVGIIRPLLFPDIVASTTIKQLKERIRQTLPARPTDENQRLIHRGRALLRDSDSLLDIFGADALRIPERQTIHLVIRDASDSSSSTPSNTTRVPSPATASQSSNAQRPQATYAQFTTQNLSNFARRTPFQTQPNPSQQPRMPSPAPPHNTPEHAAAFQQQHQSMTQWLNHLQREAMARALVNQNQRGRAQMGMRGIGDQPAANGAPAAEGSNAVVNPTPAHTIYRETVGPNGHTYQVETVIRTSAPVPPGGLSPVDVQNIIRGADSAQLTTAMTSAMQRSASGASLHRRPLHQPGVTTPIFPHGGSRAGSGRASPDPAASSIGMGNTAAAPRSVSSQQTPGLEVYILSSPEGPRGLLVNNTTSETFFTPRLMGQRSFPSLRNTPSFPNLSHMAHPQTPVQTQQPIPQANDGAQIQAQGPAQAHQAAINQQFHPNNPPAIGLPHLIAQLWAHAWLVFRLGLFIWFFTSPNTTWSRWLTVVGLALFMFVLTTGVLNGFVDNAWRPLGRHLENLLPTLDRPRPRQEPVADGSQPAGDGLAQNGVTDPAQMAARLLAERRGQRSWVSLQMRRIERAGLLFLASIAPGVAERHIANLEAEMREDERRQREAQAANEAAAAAANDSNADGQGNTDGQNENDVNGNDSHQPQQEPGGADDRHQQQEGRADNGQNERAREQLIAL